MDFEMLYLILSYFEFSFQITGIECWNLQEWQTEIYIPDAVKTRVFIFLEYIQRRIMLCTRWSLVHDALCNQTVTIWLEH